MSNSTLLILLVVVLAAVLVYMNHLHKRHTHYSPENLDKTIAGLFTDKTEYPKDEFVHMIQQAYNCNMKEAHALLGKALAHHIVTKEEGIVKKA